MADIRINSLPTTASASSSDDFLALDGATNGTRKLNAYSPTFGGNLTVNGAINAVGQNIVVSPSSGTAKGRINSDPFRADVIQVGSNWTGGAQDDATKPSWYWFFDSRVAGDGATLFRVPPGGSSTSALAISSTATTISGNLTVSGTGNSSVAGTWLIGTTTNSGNGKLQLATHNNSAGGIGFGTDVSLYRTTSNILTFGAGNACGFYLRDTNTSTNLSEFYSDTSQTFFGTKTALPLIIRTNNTTALTLDSSQNATFAGTVKIANTAQIKGVYTTTTTFDFGTIANNDASSSCVLTMTGVSSSDSIIVSPTDGNNFPQFCTVNAVPSGDSVSVRLYNGSGSSRTVGSRTIRVTAIKF